MSTRDVTKISLCIALCCVSAYISFPLPFTPGMVTALTLTMSLTAFILPHKQTFMVIFFYLLLGVIGLPVFAAGSSGLSKLLSPVGGFYLIWLIAFPLLSLFKGDKIDFKRYLLTDVFIAIPVTYLGGLCSMMLMIEITLMQALMMAVVPFIFGDILKAVAAAFIAVKLNRILKSK